MKSSLKHDDPLFNFTETQLNTYVSKNEIYELCLRFSLGALHVANCMKYRVKMLDEQRIPPNALFSEYLIYNGKVKKNPRE